MKKKLLAIFLAASMVFSVTGCGDSKGQEEEGNTAGEESTGTEREQENDGEIYNIIMQVPIFGTEMPALQEVEDAINAVTIPEIGASVTLMTTFAPSMATESSLMISSGEKLDIISILPYGAGLDSIDNYVSKNMLRPLDDLYEEYGKDIASCVGDLIKVGYSGDTLYAVPPNYVIGGARAFGARKDMLDELGIIVEEEKIYTIEELEAMFDQFKEYYGNGYYAVASFGSGQSGMFPNLHTIDTLGTDSTDGVLMEVSADAELKVENLFATAEYKEFANRMYEWNKKGYFNPDVATITDDITSLMASGIYFGSFGTVAAVDNGAMASRVGVELVSILVEEPYSTSAGATCGLWAIPNTCENPEKVMQFLNMMYQERALGEDIDTLLSYGVEGSCYTVLEEIDNSKAIISYPEGMSAADVPWMAAGPIYGNQLTIPVMTPQTAEAYEIYENFNQRIIDSGRMSNAFGYVFNPEDVSSQKAAIQAVVSEYVSTVEFGLTDPANSLPEFIKALEDAGINDVIAENQRQLDEWARVNNK